MEEGSFFFFMFLICDSKQRVESKVIPKFLTSATEDVMKPGEAQVGGFAESGWGSNEDDFRFSWLSLR